MAGKSREILTKAATEYAAAKAGDVITNLGNRASGNGEKKEKDPDSKGFVGTAAQKLGEGAGPVKAAASGIGSAVTNLFKGKGKTRRPTNIVEDCYVGVPPEQAFAAWVDYEEWAKFSKGITGVNRKKMDEEDEDAEEETDWNAKVFLSKRSWHSTTTDYDPPNRIAWNSTGSKGTIEGTVTFTPVGENGTLVLVVLEYRPKGPVEWVANRWRAAGRRARLDVKHYRRYVMRTEGEELPEPEEETPQEPEEEPEDQSDDFDENSGEVETESEEGESDDDSEESSEEESTDDGEGEAEEETPKARPTRRARG